MAGDIVTAAGELWELALDATEEQFLTVARAAINSETLSSETVLELVAAAMNLDSRHNRAAVMRVLWDAVGLVDTANDRARIFNEIAYLTALERGPEAAEAVLERALKHIELAKDVRTTLQLNLANVYVRRGQFQKCLDQLLDLSDRSLATRLEAEMLTIRCRIGTGAKRIDTSRVSTLVEELSEELDYADEGTESADDLLLEAECFLAVTAFDRSLATGESGDVLEAFAALEQLASVAASLSPPESAFNVAYAWASAQLDLAALGARVEAEAAVSAAEQVLERATSLFAAGEPRLLLSRLLLATATAVLESLGPDASDLTSRNVVLDEEFQRAARTAQQRLGRQHPVLYKNRLLVMRASVYNSSDVSQRRVSQARARLLTEEGAILGLLHPPFLSSFVSEVQERAESQRRRTPEVDVRSMSSEEIAAAFGISTSDTGRTEVQIALSSKKIALLTEHMGRHPTDYHSRRGLQQEVGKRRKKLEYLAQVDIDRYRDVVRLLGLRFRI